MSFWGLILEPNRRYTQAVQKPFRISMATLDETTSEDDPSQVILTYDKRNYLLCSLQKEKCINVPLNLKFEAGEEISFASNGNAHIHLTGFLDFDTVDDDYEELLDEEVEPVTKKRRARNVTNGDLPPQKKSKTLELLENINNDYSSEDDSDVHLSDLDSEDTTFANSSDDDDDDDDEEEDDDGEEEDDNDDEVEEEEDIDEENQNEEIEEEEEAQPKKAKINGVTPKKEKQQKHKKEMPKETPEKKQKNNKVKDQKDKTPKSVKTEPASPKKKVVQGGVVIEDLTEGNGPVAKSGKLINVYYEGKLKQNNKVFDSTLKGKGFRFRLGKEEVIKGWDVGFAGMKVGGKRRITCPPNMAYGKKGSPPVIPPHSTLVFHVELLSVQ